MMAMADVVTGTGSMAKLLGRSERTIRNYVALGRRLGIEPPFVKVGPTSPLTTTERDLFRWFAMVAKARAMNR